MILVGFRNDTFFTKYDGRYTIEIHSKPIGISIQKEKLIRTNVKELFNVESIGSFQNSSHLNISFDSTYWIVKKTFLNGKMYNLIRILNPFVIFPIQHIIIFIVICFQQIF